MKKFLLFLVALVLIVFIILGGLIGYATITDYQPTEVEPADGVVVRNKGAAYSGNKDDDYFSFLIWNIGFGGLGKDADFFYDGGEMVYPSMGTSFNNTKAMSKLLAQNDTVDFVLLQEVDVDSKRSYATNQLEYFAEVLPQHSTAFAKNYDVRFIPIPFKQPMGRVLSGLASYTYYPPSSSERHPFEGNFSWPKSVFFLDRCFLLQRFNFADRPNSLVVINTHNSAYDDGTLKAKQMEDLKALLIDEYKKGNYVVVGGDWNQTPPAFDNETFVKASGDFTEQIPIEQNYLPNWQWAYDASVPTNRKLSAPYDANSTFTTIIDFYLLSPNIELVSIKGIDLGFTHSDHQPVFMGIKLPPK